MYAPISLRLTPTMPTTVSSSKFVLGIFHHTVFDKERKADSKRIDCVVEFRYCDYESFCGAVSLIGRKRDLPSFLLSIYTNAIIYFCLFHELTGG